MIYKNLHHNAVAFDKLWQIFEQTVVAYSRNSFTTGAISNTSREGPTEAPKTPRSFDRSAYVISKITTVSPICARILYQKHPETRLEQNISDYFNNFQVGIEIY